MKIGIVGLGIMGAGMAQNFLKNDYKVFVWNRSKEAAEKLQTAGAVACDSPAKVAEMSDIVFEVTAEDNSSKAVWTGDNGILSGSGKDTILVASSTLSVKWIDELAIKCSEKGFEFFDMPLTGGRIGAETGNLTMLVGGDEKKLDELRPTLEAISGKVFHFGPAGHGTRYKLLLNMLQGIHMSAYGEVMKIAERAGMDIKAVGKALVDRPGGVSTTIAEASYKSQPDPITFSVEWITKDLQYAKDFAEGLDVPLLTDAYEKFKNLKESGKDQEDWSYVNEPSEE